MLRDFEISSDVESASKNGQLLAADLDLFRAGITGGLSLKRSVSPRELQGNNKLIFRLVTVHMKARLDDHLERLDNGRAGFSRDSLAWPDCEFILLC